MKRQPWIHSAGLDLSLIIGPPLFSSLFVLGLRPQFESHSSVGPLMWLLLVVCIDVAHVYASIFRTYWGSTLERRALLWTVPLLCWIGGGLLYWIGPSLFWTVLAYIAVFHFMRQQYGFVMIYGRGANKWRWLDRLTIYSATVYPLLFWHLNLPRKFNWFVDGDFMKLPIPSGVGPYLFATYLLVLFAYVFKEGLMSYRERSFNVPKNTLVAATALSWYVGIVYLNNDLAFTFTNVVSHGIPYVVLIWLYGRQAAPEKVARVWGRSLFAFELVPVYLGILIFLAYLEEGFWDAFVWRDHAAFFGVFNWLPQMTEPLVLALLVPLLALPQSTHYVFDAFLWRRQGHDSDWKSIFQRSQESA